MLCILDGDYRGYKTLQKDYAKIAVKNPELLDELDSPSIRIPLFSKVGLKFLKVWFLNLFRHKTPEEKELKKIVAHKRLAKKYNIDNMD